MTSTRPVWTGCDQERSTVGAVLRCLSAVARTFRRRRRGFGRSGWCDLTGHDQFPVSDVVGAFVPSHGTRTEFLRVLISIGQIVNIRRVIRGYVVTSHPTRARPAVRVHRVTGTVLGSPVRPVHSVVHHAHTVRCAPTSCQQVPGKVVCDVRKLSKNGP
jgi:hypothetical protein